MSVKLRLSTSGAGNSRHGSARVVACDEALPAPGGALKIAARIGRSWRAVGAWREAAADLEEAFEGLLRGTSFGVSLREPWHNSWPTR